MSDEVTSIFSVADRGWSQAAESRLTALGLTPEAVATLLVTAAVDLQEAGGDAGETYGAPEVWATEQVNTLAEEGALEMRPLPWESGRHWMHVCGLAVASVYGTFGALQLFGFTSGPLPAAWVLVGGFLGLCTALGAWGQYVITPRSTMGGWLLSGAGAMPGVVAVVALWFSGPHSPGIDVKTVFWGFLDRMFQSAIWVQGSGLSVITWFVLAGVLGIVSSPWKLWQVQDLLAVRRSATLSEPSVSTDRELSDWQWRGLFRRLAHYRWHLAPENASQLEEHFRQESAPKSLHSVHGDPTQALAWTAPIYREDPAYADDVLFEPRRNLGPLVAFSLLACVFVISQIAEKSAPWWVIVAATLGSLGGLALIVASGAVVHHEFSLQRFTNTTRKNDPVADYYRDAE